MDSRGAAEPPALPAPMCEALAAFERHLAAERGVSPHTVRAYLGDVRSLMAHAAGAGATTVGSLDIGLLRSWLASQHGTGYSRATMARRAAAARAFTAFAAARELISTDPGRLLGTPKTHRRLPRVLCQEQMAAVLAAPSHGTGGQGPPASACDAQGAGASSHGASVRDTQGAGPSSHGAADGGGSDGDGKARALLLRDTAIMELLYASGIRVSELCGLDVGDLDEERHTVRVLGKGSRERTVPAGNPAVRAVSAWVAEGLPLPRRTAAARCSSAPAVGG